MKKGLNIFFMTLLPVVSFCQARIIFNGAAIAINNNGKLVIANAAPDALTVATSGGIISEGAGNILIWKIGNTAANYIVPFMSGGNNIPVSFATSGSTGSGLVQLSTYAGPGWQNSNYLPPTVMNVNRNGADNSDHVIDRFWQINAVGYTTSPSLSGLVFSYKENEWNETGNIITESKLTAQNWDNTSNAWLPPLGTDNVSANRVTVLNVPGSDLHPWWTLVSSDNALPLTLLNFTAEKQNSNAVLKWIVSAQVNVSFYEVQRSFNAIDFVPVGNVAATYTTNATQSYSYSDALVNINSPVIYYRLRMIDSDGKFSYSDVRDLLLSGDKNKPIQISPNPATGFAIIRFGDISEGPYQLSVINAEGKQVMTEKLAVTRNSAFYFDRNNMAAGSYFFKITGQNINKVFTILFQ